MSKQIILGKKLIKRLREMEHPFSKLLIDSHNNKEEIVDNSYINFIVDEGMISFLPVNKEKDYTSGKEISEDDKWKKNRQKISIGRLIRAILERKSVQFVDKDIEEFVNEYKLIQYDFKFKLVKGADIGFWYNQNRYSDETNGSLNNSCMRGVNSSYFKIYEDNENVEMLCLIDKKDKLIARAIVWKNVKIEYNGKTYIGTFLDRIYSCRDSFEIAIKNYCKNKCWWYKTLQGIGRTSISNGYDILSNPTIIFKMGTNINWEKLRRYPYVDTMAFFGYLHEIDNQVPVLVNYSTQNFKLEIRRQDGTFSENDSYNKNKDIFNRNLNEDLIIIAYNNGFKWIDTNANLGTTTLSLVDSKNNILTSVNSYCDSIGYKYRNITNVTINQEYEMFIVDLLLDDIVSERQLNINWKDISVEKFTPLFNKFKNNLEFTTNSFSEDQFKIVVKDHADLLLNSNLEQFLKFVDYVDDDIISQYIFKYNEINKKPLRFNNGKILIKISEDVFKDLLTNRDISWWNKNENISTVLDTIIGKFLFINDENGIFVEITSRWFYENYRIKKGMNVFYKGEYGVVTGNKIPYLVQVRFESKLKYCFLLSLEY